MRSQIIWGVLMVALLGLMPLCASVIAQPPTDPQPSAAPAEEITPPAEKPAKPQLDKFHVTVAQFVGTFRGETQVRVMLLDRDIEVPEGYEFEVGADHPNWIALVKKGTPKILWAYRAPADAEITINRLTPITAIEPMPPE